MSDCAPVRTVTETRFNASAAASQRNPMCAGFFLLFALLSLAPAGADAQDYHPPTEASNLPANLRPLIPRGWVATSFAEVDMNKDGNLDRAVLLAPNVAGNSVVGPIAGTSLRDRCRNLLLLVGQPNGLPAVANYLPWSQLHESLGVTMRKDTCLGQEPPEDFDGAGPIGFSDGIKAVRNTLRYPWEATDWPGESGGTLVLRIEGTCLRLIGEERTESNHGATWQSRDESSTNYLTRENVSSSSWLELCGGGDCEDEEKIEGPSTTKIEQRAPICLNDRPLLLTTAPQQQPQAPAPAPAPPKATPPPRYSYSPPTVSSPPPPLDCSKPPSRQKRIDNSQVGSGFDPNTPFCGLDTETSDPFESSGCQLPIIVVPLGLPFIATRDDDYETDSIVAVNGCGLWIQSRTDGACFFESDPGCTEPPSVGEPELLRAQPDGSFLYQEPWQSGTCYPLKIEPLSDDRFRVTAVTEECVREPR